MDISGVAAWAGNLLLFSNPLDTPCHTTKAFEDDGAESETNVWGLAR
jgi:hypothetical protein